MRKKFLSLIAAALALLCLLTGCSAGTKEQNEQAVENGNEAYLTRIAELETLLQKEREEKYISDSAYEKRIAELEKELLAEAPTQGETKGEESVFHYRLQDGKAILTGYEGSSPLINIPATLDGYPVVAIGERAFEGTSPVAVTIPDGVEAIGWFAFYGCSALTDITVPASVKSIGYAVFDGCSKVTIICASDSYAKEYAESFGLAHLSP